MAVITPHASATRKPRSTVPVDLRPVYWNTNTNACTVAVQANTGSKDYSTVSIDIIGTQGQGSSAVRKRVKASIYNVHPNGKCPTATYTPRTPPP